MPYIYKYHVFVVVFFVGSNEYPCTELVCDMHHGDPVVPQIGWKFGVTNPGNIPDGFIYFLLRSRKHREGVTKKNIDEYVRAPGAPLQSSMAVLAKTRRHGYHSPRDLYLVGTAATVQQ